MSIDFRAYARTAQEQLTEAPESEPPPQPTTCSYCGSTEFEPEQHDNGRVQRAKCAACGGTMVSNGGTWMPDLIGQIDNHPSDKADPASGGVGGAANAPVVPRENDLSSRTAGANGPPPEGLEITERKYAKGEDEHNSLEMNDPGWDHAVLYAHVPQSEQPVGHIEYSSKGDQVKIHETHTHSNWRRRGVASALDEHLQGLFPDHKIDRGGATEEGESWRSRTALADWCRHRHAGHCWLPRHEAPGGIALYVPQDRGICPWTTPQTQQINCPMSEAGPMAGMTRAGASDRCPACDGSGDDPSPPAAEPGHECSVCDGSGRKTGAIWSEPDWRFHVLATWADVRTKAKRIRSEGGVSIVSAMSDGVTGHVNGDTGVYESQINYVPGSFKIGHWQCGCAWASYAWGRSPAFRRFEGRMCSHALALQFEAQARGMFGRTVQDDTKAPDWLRDKVRVRHDRQTRDHDVRAASLSTDPYPEGHGLDLVRSPIHAFAVEAYAVRGDPADVMRVFLAAGIERADARQLLEATLTDQVIMSVRVAVKEPDEPTHAGVVLKAADTGRVLMIQRSNNDPKDPAAGTWEWPGGGREEGDGTSLHSGIREFEEEVGQQFPLGGHVQHVWQSPNGVYQGHVVVVPSEDCLDFGNGRATVNPDDPDGDDHEQSAWWDPDHAQKNPALRPECKSSPWKMIKSAGLFAEDEPKGPPVDWRSAQPAALHPDEEHCAVCGKPAAMVHTIEGKGYCAEHADELQSGPHAVSIPGWLRTPGGEIPERPKWLQKVHADYASGDFLEDAGTDWRPKAPPPPPEPGQPENPGSTGWATGGDPPEWDIASQSPSKTPLTSWSSLDDSLEFGAELHDPHEPALPSTTAEDEEVAEPPAVRYRSQMSSEIPEADMDTTPNSVHASVSDTVAAFQATAGAALLRTEGGPDNVDIASAARAHLAGDGSNTGNLQRTALKNFSSAEQLALISEGGAETRARNMDDLQIQGTHYEALTKALADEAALTDPELLFD